MEKASSNKKNNVFQIILYIAVVILIVVVIYQNRRINILSRDNPEVSQGQKVTDEKAINNKAVQQAHSTGDNSKSHVVMDTAGKKTDDNNKMKVAAGKPVDAAKSNPPSGEIRNIMGKLASEIQNNPAMESMIRNQLTTRLNDTYGAFAEEYNLSPEKRPA
jgi:hypothetical protein